MGSPVPSYAISMPVFGGHVHRNAAIRFLPCRRRAGFGLERTLEPEGDRRFLSLLGGVDIGGVPGRRAARWSLARCPQWTASARHSTS